MSVRTSTSRLLVLPEGRFHYVWLLDNCLCSRCRHPDSYQKRERVVPTVGVPPQVDVEADRVILHWNGDENHVSIFPRSWLARFNSGAAPESEYDARRVLWRASDGVLPAPIVYGEELVHGLDWLEERLAVWGFAIVEGMPAERLGALVSEIGPVHHTEYGAVAEIRASGGANDIAETSFGLAAHTDYSTYMRVPPLIQLLYCTCHDVTGGESVIVDGFRVASDLREADPEAFGLLASVPVEFQQLYDRWRYFFRRRQRVIELDPDGELHSVHVGHSHSHAWRLPLEHVEAYYAAYRRFGELAADPAYELVRPLAPGDCVIVDNRRVLHGRRAFNSAGGERALRVMYVSLDFLQARIRYEREAVEAVPVYAAVCR